MNMNMKCDFIPFYTFAPLIDTNTPTTGEHIRWLLLQLVTLTPLPSTFWISYCFLPNVPYP